MNCGVCNHREVCRCFPNPEEYCSDFEPERPHGEWVEVPKYNGFYVCSKCLERLGGDFERFDHWEMKKENFCGVCGSDNRLSPSQDCMKRGEQVCKWIMQGMKEADEWIKENGKNPYADILLEKGDDENESHS